MIWLAVCKSEAVIAPDIWNEQAAASPGRGVWVEEVGDVQDGDASNFQDSIAIGHDIAVGV